MTDERRLKMERHFISVRKMQDEKIKAIHDTHAKVLDLIVICGPYEFNLLKVDDDVYYATFPEKTNAIDVLEYIEDAGISLISYDEYNIVYAVYSGTRDVWEWAFRIQMAWGKVEIRIRIDSDKVAGLSEYIPKRKLSYRPYAPITPTGRNSGADIYANDSHQQLVMMKYINKVYETTEGDTDTPADS